MVGDFGWEHEGTKSGVGTVNKVALQYDSWLHKRIWFAFVF